MVNFNGNIVENDKATLNIANRGYTYGDSLFETIRVINNKIVFWEDHYFRLMASMRIIRMDIPHAFSPEYLEQEILNTVAKNTIQNARVKLQVHRKEGGLYRPENRDVEFLISVSPLKDPFYILNESTYEVELFKDHYMQSGLLSTIKSNNRLINILGSIYAEENDYHNCFLLNQNKMVTETLNGNLFVVSGKTIKTPPLEDGCLNGIVRKQLIKIIEKLDSYTLIEESVSPFELQKADELFTTNTIQGIQPISKYRKKEFGAEIAKDLLGKLNAHARLS